MHEHSRTRRRALQLGLGTALGSSLGGPLASAAFAQSGASAADWPNRLVTLVVGFPPGGQTDFAGRVAMAGMQAHLGQTVIIDNRGGANGNLATDHMNKVVPDGYRLLVGNGGNMTLNPYTYRTPVADPQKLTPIGVLLQSSMILVVPTTLPVRTLAEFRDWVKAQDAAGKTVDYASSGAGSMTQATMELFRNELGKPRMNHVPYKGSGQATTDLIAGRVSAMFDGSSVVAPFIRSGQMRPLMVTGAKRVPAFPDIPTAVELGHKDFQLTAFIGLYGPPGLHPDIVRKANAALNAAMKDPAVQKVILDRGDEPGGGTPEQLAELTRHYSKLWGEVVKANGDIRAE